MKTRYKEFKKYNSYLFSDIKDRYINKSWFWLTVYIIITPGFIFLNLLVSIFLPPEND